MLMLHGPGMPTRPKVRAADRDVEAEDTEEVDDGYENDLFGLLAQLEYLREAMDGARLAPMLALATQMLDQVSAFADRASMILPGHDPAGPRVAEFRAALKPLLEPVKDTGPRNPALTDRCFAALYDAVFAYFVVFTNRFPTSRAGRDWVEVAATFVSDLKRTLRDPEPRP